MPAPGSPVSTDPGPPTSAPAVSASRARLLELGELVGLCTLAIAQPVLAVFANDPETFVFYDAGQAVIMAFALVVIVVPPLALWLGEQAVGLVRLPAQRWVHLGLVGVLVALFAIQLLGEATDLSQTIIYGASTLIGVVVAYYYWRFGALRRGLLFLVALAPVIAIWFVFVSPVSDIAAAEDEPETAVEVPVDNPAPVVMVQLDELPTMSLLDASGQIDAELFPNFARLAADSTWFRNHTTVAGTTNRALPAILSGRYPTLAERVPTAEAHPDSLFSLLASTYDMHATEQISLMCPSSLCTSETADTAWSSSVRGLLGEAWDVWREQIAGEPATIATPDPEGAAEAGIPSDIGFPSDDTVGDQAEVFRTFIDSLADSDQPRLDYLHVGLPHVPWQYLPSGTRHGYDGPGWPADTELSQVPPVFRQIHVLQLQYTDALVGELLDRLDELGVYDDTLVVLTADHGTSLSQLPIGRYLRAGTTSELAWTPLFVKEPNQASGVVDDRPVQIIDIVPTIAEVLGVTIPWTVDGVSAVSSTPAASGVDVRFIADSTTDMEPTDGEYIVLDRAQGFQRMLDAGLVRVQGDPLVRLFGSGRYAGIVGRDLADLTIGEPTGATVEVAPPGVTRFVEPDANEIPAGFNGVVSPALTGEIAIAVNGRIGTIASRVDLDNTTLATGILPEELLPAGTHEIELYLVDGNPGAEVLHLIPAADG